MAPRILQRSARGPIVALMFCGDRFAAHRSSMLDAIGLEATVLALDADPSHDEMMRAAILAEDPARPRWIVGYSAGGHRARDLLDLVRDGDTVITADATHASLEQRPQTMPIGPWLALGERAEAGAVRWLSSHTYLTYVEHLAEPYYATVTVMRRASRQLLPEPTIDAGVETDVGELRVYSYRSGDADAAAHRRQLVEVLPVMLRRARQLQAGEEPSVPRWVHAVVDPFLSVVERLWAVFGRAPTRGEIALGRAQAALALGVHEVAGPASHPTIAEALAGCQRGGKPVGLTSDETDWCAAFASWCALGQGGAGAPHGWRISVRELVEDARASGAFRDVSTGYTPSPGDLAIYARAGEDPRRGGRGHVARVESVGADGYVTIGGNEGNVVRRTERLRADPALVGWIAY